MKCTHCGKEVPDSAKICGYCGKPIPKPAKFTCPDCGKEVPAKAKVCGYCGAKLVKPAAKTKKPATKKAVPEPAAPVEAKQAKEKGKLPKWALPAGLGVIAVALAIWFVMQPSSQPETAVIEPQQESAAESAAEPSSKKEILVSGKWVGEIKGVTGDFSATLELDIDQRCSYYDICGSYKALDFDSSGDLELVSISGWVYKFLEHPSQQVEELLEGSGYQYMQLINDSLSWSFEQTLPSGEKVESTGTFYRK